MPTLFVLSHAPHTDPLQGRRLDMALPGDAVVLIEDAVYAAGAVLTPLTPHLNDAVARGISLHVLEPDLQARGVETGMDVVDYGGMVDLIAEYDRSVH